MFPLEPGKVPDLERLRQCGLEMPMFGVTGDNDGWITEHPEDPASSISETIETFLELAGTEPKKAEKPSPMYYQPDEHRDARWYRDNFGFREADRFDTWIYNNASGEPRVAITVMKNMPHGTIWEETAAANHAQQAKRAFDRRQELLSAFLSHEELDEIAIDFAELEVYGQEGSREEFRARCEALLFRLRHVAEMDVPFYYNFL